MVVALQTFIKETPKEDGENAHNEEGEDGANGKKREKEGDISQKPIQD